MPHSRISAYLFLVVSISALTAAVTSVYFESPADNIYLGIGLFCGVVSLSSFRKRKQRKGIKSN
jgi:hypothetical membrane protein